MTGNQAGHSAQEQARLRREKIQRLERSAAAWEAGAVGEQATGQVLARFDPAVWVTWHDVRWPGRQRANIDHVVVGPPGVFVIDSKNWSGTVAIKDGVLRQNGRSRETAVVGVAEAGIAVLEIVPDVPIHPVLCLVREESFTGWVRDVMLCSTGNLDVMLQTRPQVLTPEQVRATAARLEAGLSHGRGASRQSGTQRVARRPKRPSTLRTMVGVLMMVLVGLVIVTGVVRPALTQFGDRLDEVIVEEVRPSPAENQDPEPGDKDRRAKKRQGRQQS